MVTIFAIAASSWAVLMGLAPALQLRQMLRRRSSADVSIGYLLVLLPGFALWIGYGVAAGNLVLVIPNSVALIVAAATTAVAVRLRDPATRARQRMNVNSGSPGSSVIGGPS